MLYSVRNPILSIPQHTPIYAADLPLKWETPMAFFDALFPRFSEAKDFHASSGVSLSATPSAISTFFIRGSPVGAGSRQPVPMGTLSSNRSSSLSLNIL